MTLCQSFRDLSHQTWMQLAKARSVDHQMLEDSVTDMLMVDLKFRHPFNVITKTFTRSEEFINGADWEWWFVDSSGSKGIGFRVQAKIINFETNSFKQLHYRSKNSAISQTEKLIDDARNSTVTLIPIYCLYIHCDNLLSSFDIVDLYIRGILFNCTVEHLGCSILSAYKVKDLKKTKKQHIIEIFEYVKPWHSLVCPPIINPNSNLSLPERTWAWAKENNLAGEHSDDYLELPNNGIVPNYVKDIMNEHREKSLNDNYYNLDESFKALGGIMIVKE